MSHLMYDKMYNPPQIDKQPHIERLGIKKFSELSEQERKPFESKEGNKYARKKYESYIQTLLNSDPIYQQESKNWNKKKLEYLLKINPENNLPNYSCEFNELLKILKNDFSIPNQVIISSYVSNLIDLILQK